MAETVRLLFPPYMLEGAEWIDVEGSDSAEGAFAQVEGFSLVDAGDPVVPGLGAFPDYPTLLVLSVEDPVPSWFRVVWRDEDGGVALETSAAWQPGTLPGFYIVPAQVTSFSQLPRVQSMASVYLHWLIVRAFFMLHGSCGPFDEDKVLPLGGGREATFSERATLAMIMLTERLALASDPQVLAASLGFISETRGSYSYRLSERAIEIVQGMAEGVPLEILELICPFGSWETGATLSTEVVFRRAAARATGLPPGVDEVRVFTQEDRHLASPPSPKPPFGVG